ncbi:hypothetical protein PS664_05935 [Pseudomonas fluorescens]|nr:hypothetical protein PS664_05935 [Pseudomonas fluorescens]
MALEQVLFLLRYGMGVQALLVVVVVVAEQLALLALVFLTGLEQVRSQYRAV